MPNPALQAYVPLAGNLHPTGDGEDLPASRLPAATTSVKGAMSAADKTKLDAVPDDVDASIAALSSSIAAKADASTTTTALSGKQPLHALLTSLAGLTLSAGSMLYATSASALAAAPSTSYGRSILDSADAPAARTTLGLTIGTNVQAYSTVLQALTSGVTMAANKAPYFTDDGSASTMTVTSFARSVLDDADEGTARATLGVAIGSQVQAYHPTLLSLANLGYPAAGLPYFPGGGAAALATFTTGQIFIATSGTVIAAQSPDTAGLLDKTTVQTASNKTFVAPTIVSLVNAQHTHVNAAGGGTLTAAAISDFNTSVRLNRLDQMAAPSANVSMGGQQITSLAAGTSAGDAVNVAQLQSASFGISWKDNARAAATTNVTVSNPGTATFDGVTLDPGDRLFLPAQSTGSQNGLYTFNGSSSALTRTADADSSAEVTGMVVVVDEGTNNAATIWQLITPSPTLGVTSLTFRVLPGPQDLIAGAGMTRSGNTFDVVTADAGRIVVNANNIDLATTGVTPATYYSVAVDAYGRVTSGSTDAALVASNNLGDLTDPAVAVANLELADVASSGAAADLTDLTSPVIDLLTSFTSANLRAALFDKTGTGNAVFGTSPTLVTPNLGTPSTLVLTSATGLPVASGISGLGTGVATFLATPSSANLAAALTDESGSSTVAFTNSPTFVTPVLGAATATSLSASGAVSGLLQDKGAQVYYALQYSVVGDGTTNDATNLNSLITTANSAGGGIVYLPSGKVYAISASITLKSDVLVVVGKGATVKWTGSGGTMFTNSAAALFRRGGVIGHGAILDPNASADYVFDLHSPQYCEFGGFEVSAGTTTTIYCRVQANGLTTGGYESSSNAVFNRFGPVSCDGTIGTVYQLSGTDSTHVVTLNTFKDIEARRVCATGIDLVQWCDNNTFEGYVRLELFANNSIGVNFNSGTPGSDVGVYSTHFNMLAVDTFAGPTGRVGIKFGRTKSNIIRGFHQNPVAEGGSIVDNSASTDTYYIHTAQTGTAMQVLQKGTQFGFDPDANHWIGTVSSQPAHVVDSNDYWYYDRSLNQYVFAIASTPVAKITTGGLVLSAAMVAQFTGATSGTTNLQASAVAGTTTLTLPAATDTLVGKATTDILSNKTFSDQPIVSGAGQTTADPTTASSLGGSILLKDTGSSVGNGGMVVFASSFGSFAAIKGSIVDGSSNTAGDIVVATRTAAADSTLTGKWSFKAAGHLLALADNTYDIGASAATRPRSIYAGTSVVSAGSISSKSATAGIGYAAGAGGAVTQGTNRTTGVTLNTVSGAITLVSAAGSTTAASFTVTNSTVAATDTVVVSQKSGTDKYDIGVSAVSAGSFVITFRTFSGTTTEQPVFNFNVFKGVAS